jgi:hypothetical protein
VSVALRASCGRFGHRAAVDERERLDRRIDQRLTTVDDEPVVVAG